MAFRSHSTHFLVDEEEVLAGRLALASTSSIGTQMLGKVRDGLASAQTTSLSRKRRLALPGQRPCRPLWMGCSSSSPKKSSPAGAVLEKLGAEDPHASRTLHDMLDRLQGIEDNSFKYWSGQSSGPGHRRPSSRQPDGGRER